MRLLEEAAHNATDGGDGVCGHGEEGFQTIVVVGILIHVLGSVGINTGQNLQSMALLGKASQTPPCSELLRNKMWLIGTGMFAGMSILNFVALTLAPASILVPLESVQFVTNVMFAKWVRKVPVPPRMLWGVASMIAGTVLAVVFGPLEGQEFTEDDLKSYWADTAWWVWLIISIVLSVVSLILHNRWYKMKAAGNPPPYSQYIMPIAYAVPSALLGGAQMIVQSKSLAEMGEMMITGASCVGPECAPLAITGWFFWVIAILVCVLGLFWFYRLTVSLGMYDPLFIIPLMQACFILFGGVAGGIFFHEFDGIHCRLLGYGNWPLYILGFVLVLLGLYLVRTDTSAAEEQEKTRRSMREMQTAAASADDGAEMATTTASVEGAIGGSSSSGDESSGHSRTGYAANYPNGKAGHGTSADDMVVEDAASAPATPGDVPISVARKQPPIASAKARTYSGDGSVLPATQPANFT